MSEQNGTFRVPTEEEEDDNIIFRCISNLRAVTTALGKRILGDKALTAQEEIRQKRCNVVPDRPDFFTSKPAATIARYISLFRESLSFADSAIINNSQIIKNDLFNFFLLQFVREKIVFRLLSMPK